MRGFLWCTRKTIQNKTLFLLFFLPESFFVRVEVTARMQGVETAAVDTCPKRTNVGDLEAAEPIRSEAGVALEAVLTLVVVLEAVVLKAVVF